jgi:hypothetical protein
MATVLILAAGLVNGCATWRYVPNENAAGTIRNLAPSRARVTAAGSTVEVTHPSVLNDSLIGTVEHEGRYRTSFALGSIDSLSIRSTNRTAGWVVAGVSAVLITAFFLSDIDDPIPIP